MTDNTSRVVAVWDTYKADSLKHQTRVHIGEVGSRNRVASNLLLPKGAELQKFLKESTNYLGSLVRSCSSTLHKKTTIFSPQNVILS